jgi:hypothetical protein
MARTCVQVTVASPAAGSHLPNLLREKGLCRQKAGVVPSWQSVSGARSYQSDGGPGSAVPASGEPRSDMRLAPPSLDSTVAESVIDVDPARADAIVFHDRIGTTHGSPFERFLYLSRQDGLPRVQAGVGQQC